jgi:hypothetical protein
MIRTTLLGAILVFSSSAAFADANLIVLSDKDNKPADFGYSIRSAKAGKTVTITLDLTPAAAKAFGSGELTLTRGGKTIVEATIAMVKDGTGKGTLKLTLDSEAVDGGELLIWSGYIEGAPPTINFGGFRIMIATLMAGEEDRAELVMKAMDGFRKKLPEPQGLNEMNGVGVNDIDGNSHPDSHLNGIATRLGVETRAECLALLTYLKDPDPKIRRIAAFALEGVVKAYPNGMSSSDIQDVTSEGHRKMVKAFAAGIEKLPR